MNADDVLVPTKFAPPRVGPRHVPRARLLERLREMEPCALTVIRAGAGFGKTILLVQWRRELMTAGAEVAWLSLTPDDGAGSSPATFYRHLLASLQRAGVTVAPEAMAAGAAAHPIDSMVAAIHAAAQSFAKALYVFLDDFHHLADKHALELMQKLLNHCPARLHFVLASRVQPPLSLSRLRVYGQIAELSMQDLAFGTDETRVFFEQNLPTVPLNADELRRVHDLTDGWPAALQLAAIMLRGRPAAREQLQDMLWRSSELQDYLSEDVIARAAPDLVAFIETLSVLGRFNADLAAHVTGTPDAATMIQRAEDQGLMIQRIDADDRAPWFRFHPLFAEFLARRLAQRGPGEAEAAHRLAARWYASRNMLTNAVRHANLGADIAFAMDAIQQSSPDQWSPDHIGPILHLLERLPEPMLSGHPHLLLLGCFTYALTDRPALAEQWLARIRASSAADDPRLANELRLAEAAIATQRDDSERVLALLTDTPAPQGRFLRYVWLGALVNAYAGAGRFADASALLDAHLVISPADRGNGDNLDLLVRAARPQVALVAGNAGTTAQLAAPVLADAEAAHGRHSVYARQCAACLGDALYEMDRIDAARETLANRRGLLASSTPEVMIRASLAHARMLRLQDGLPAALAFLEGQASHFQMLSQDRPVAYMLHERVHMLLEAGAQSRAQPLCARLEGLAERHHDASGYLAEIPLLGRLARARVALAACDAPAALAHLDAAGAMARASGRARLGVTVHVLSALACHDAGQPMPAWKHLQQALSGGDTLGLVRTFLDEGQRIAPLLAEFRSTPGLPPAPACLDGLLGKLGHVAHATAAPADSRRKQPGQAGLGVNLTPRELEILRLISQAMSNKRIALTLNITLGTTKWNVRNILTKLGVSTRYDAMMWARRNGFID